MKYIKPATYGVLLLLFYVSFFFSTNSVLVIYLRHINLLAFIGLSLYDITNAYQKNILRNRTLSERQTNVLLYSRLVLFAVIMIVTASVQFEYIDYAYTLHEKSWTLYDDYHNVLYAGAYQDEYPEVEVIEKADDYLELVITHTLHSFHEELWYDDKPYTNVDVTTKKQVFITVEYTNGIIDSVHFRKHEWSAHESDSLTFGFAGVLDQMIDYQDGYVFKQASDVVELLASYDGIMNQDLDLFTFSEEDYEVTEYFVREKVTVENYIAYDLYYREMVEDEMTDKTILEFIKAKDQTDSIQLTEYSVNIDISEDSAALGLALNVSSFMYTPSNIQINNTMEYEGEGYYNTYLFPREGLPVLESHYLNHIENMESTYEGFTDVKTFMRNSTKFYYLHRTYTGEFQHNEYESYQTIEKTSYGYLVTEYDYYSGDFNEFLFHRYEQDPHTFYLLNHPSSIYQDQLESFSSSRNPFYDHLYDTFVTIPIYIQKTALE